MVGTPALAVALAGAVRVLAYRGLTVDGFTVLRPAGRGPLVLAARCDEPESEVIVELYGQNQRSGGVLGQSWRWLSFRSSEMGPARVSMRAAIEHCALMGIAIADLGVASTTSPMAATLDRGWQLYAHSPPRGTPIDAGTDPALLTQVWKSLGVLRAHQIAHGDLRSADIRHDNGRILVGGFAHAEFGASGAQLHSDIAQLLTSMTAIFGAERTVAAAVDAVGEEAVLTASGRLTRSAMPSRIRTSVVDVGAVMSELRGEVLEQTGTAQIRAEQVTRFTRNQILQLVLLIALVYVAYPYISAVPAFFTQLRTANSWWAMLGLGASALTYVGAATALWACASRSVGFRRLAIMQVANTFAATTTPAGVGGLALSVRLLQKGGLSAARATAAVALQQSVQVLTHVGLLILFSIVAGTSADLSRFVPAPTVLYLVGGVGILGTVMFVPTLREWLDTAVRPPLQEILAELGALARDPKRLAVILLGSAATTLGAAAALWASIEAFGGGTTFITVTIVTMIGGTLASAAPTPGGVGAVEAALIGGLAAFGLTAGIAVPSVLLYRVLTTWLPTFCGWPTMRWLSSRDMI